MRSGRHQTFPGFAKRDAPLALFDLCCRKAGAHCDMEMEIALEMFGEDKPQKPPPTVLAIVPAAQELFVRRTEGVPYQVQLGLQA